MARSGQSARRVPHPRRRAAALDGEGGPPARPARRQRSARYSKRRDSRRARDPDRPALSVAPAAVPDKPRPHDGHDNGMSLLVLVVNVVVPKRGTSCLFHTYAVSAFSRTGLAPIVVITDFWIDPVTSGWPSAADGSEA